MELGSVNEYTGQSSGSRIFEVMLKLMKLIPIFIALLYALTALITDYFARAAYGIVAIGIIFLVVTFTVSIIVRFIKGKWIAIKVYPFVSIVILGCICNVAIAYFMNPSPLPPQGKDVLVELKGIFDTDQSDRATWRYSRDPTRDLPRIKRVLELYNGQLIRSPEEKYYAAWVLHHGGTTENHRLANSLAKDAFESNPTRDTEWLYHATYDRLQLSLGLPQKYGSQHVF